VLTELVKGDRSWQCRLEVARVKAWVQMSVSLLRKDAYRQELAQLGLAACKYERNDHFIPSITKRRPLDSGLEGRNSESFRSWLVVFVCGSWASF
jgi:hypothetical protein